MKTVALAALVAAALVMGTPPLMGAEGARFKHLVSVYIDDKGAGLHLPEGVACDNRGQLLIGDTGNDRLVRFTFLDKAVSGGSEIKIPELTAPTVVHITTAGDIYALDGKQRRIVHLGPGGEFKTFLSFEDVPPPATVIPKSFTIDSAGNVYVLDAFAARILVLDPGGKFQRALVLPGDAGFVTDVTTVEATGGVVVLDAIKRRLFSAARDGSAFAPLGGDLTESLVTLPTSLVAHRGVVFVVEGAGGSIAAFGQDGTFVTRQLVAGWKEGSLSHPSQMCINEKDEAFIADRNNSRVQVFALGR